MFRVVMVVKVKVVDAAQGGREEGKRGGDAGGIAGGASGDQSKNECAHLLRRFLFLLMAEQGVASVFPLPAFPRSSNVRLEDQRSIVSHEVWPKIPPCGNHRLSHLLGISASLEVPELLLFLAAVGERKDFVANLRPVFRSDAGRNERQDPRRLGLSTLDAFPIRPPPSKALPLCRHPTKLLSASSARSCPLSPPSEVMNPARVFLLLLFWVDASPLRPADDDLLYIPCLVLFPPFPAVSLTDSHSSPLDFHASELVVHLRSSQSPSTSPSTPAVFRLVCFLFLQLLLLLLLLLLPLYPFLAVFPSLCTFLHCSQRLVVPAGVLYVLGCFPARL